MVDHWIWCNLYPKKAENVATMLLSIYAELKKLQKIPKQRQTEGWVKSIVEPWLETLKVGLDIRTMDVGFRRRQETLFGVKETDAEESFWQDQINGKRVGYCDNFVDRKWIAQSSRRKRDREGMMKRMEKSDEGKRRLAEKVEVPMEYDDNQNDVDKKDKNYDEKEDLEENSKKRRRSCISSGSAENTGSLPKNYRHVRTGVKHVRPEFYTAVDRYRVALLVLGISVYCYIIGASLSFTCQKSSQLGPPSSSARSCIM